MEKRATSSGRDSLGGLLTRLAAFVLCLSPLCFGQMNGELFVVSQLMARAHVSGSISYWGRGPCSYSSHEHYAPAPALGNYTPSAPILKTLREIFSDDPKMRVTQESGGIVRMFETDVPRDLLDIKIHHISFDVPWNHGPNMAIRVILSAPEVQRYRKAHEIGPSYDLFILSSDAGHDNPSVSGSLDNVTVSQALDYIFKTFSGLWIYSNCPNEAKGKERDVYFWSFMTSESDR
jgi:hypothetical protein